MTSNGKRLTETLLDATDPLAAEAAGVLAAVLTGNAAAGRAAKAGLQHITAKYPEATTGMGWALGLGLISLVSLPVAATVGFVAGAAALLSDKNTDGRT